MVVEKYLKPVFYWKGKSRVCLRPACSVWVLDFVQENFYNRSPGDFESTFIKAGDSKTRKGLE